MTGCRCVTGFAEARVTVDEFSRRNSRRIPQTGSHEPLPVSLIPKDERIERAWTRPVKDKEP